MKFLNADKTEDRVYVYFPNECYNIFSEISNFLQFDESYLLRSVIEKFLREKPYMHSDFVWVKNHVHGNRIAFRDNSIRHQMQLLSEDEWSCSLPKLLERNTLSRAETLPLATIGLTSVLWWLITDFSFQEESISISHYLRFLQRNYSFRDADLVTIYLLIFDSAFPKRFARCPNNGNPENTGSGVNLSLDLFGKMEADSWESASSISVVEKPVKDAAVDGSAAKEEAVEAGVTSSGDVLLRIPADYVAPLREILLAIEQAMVRYNS